MPLHEERNNVMDRLAKIEGHVCGIQRMIEENKECPEVLLQLVAVRSSARDKVGRIVLEDHIKTCVTQAVRDGKGEKAMLELKDALMKFF